MNDPYRTLGVSPNSSDEEIKKAYRELARKYHPDNYHDNPLADLAQEKMKEINEAYDTITKQRANGGNSSGGFSGSYSWNSNRGYSGNNSWNPGGYSSSGGIYSQIRSAINAGQLDHAERLLDSVDIGNRGAEWNFLMGSLYYRKGWLDEAMRFFRDAARMEPGNPEYQQALNYMQNGGAAYRSAPGGMANFDGCDICSSLLLADCCCECMGGDLIPCC